MADADGLWAADIEKRYDNKTALANVSLGVRSRQVVGLLGPNGAGKTTCFHILVGLMPADRGSLSLDGGDITRLPLHRRVRMGLGYLPQEPSIFRLTARDNLLAVLELAPGMSSAQRRRRADELLEEFNLSGLADNPAQLLSGGERRRLEIARALTLNPKFLLLDEPFAGVDPVAVGGIKQLIRHLTDLGIGVLLTDHNVRDTLDICDYIYVLHESRILGAGDRETIVSDERVRQIYLGDNFG